MSSSLCQQEADTCCRNVSGSVFTEPPLLSRHIIIISPSPSHICLLRGLKHSAHRDTPLGLIVLTLNMNTATILFIVNACVIRNSLIIIYILYSVRMFLVCKILDLPTINPIFVRDYKIPNLVPEGSPPLERVFSINYCDNGLVNCLFAYQPWTRSLWDQSVSRS